MTWTDLVLRARLLIDPDGRTRVARAARIGLFLSVFIGMKAVAFLGLLWLAHVASHEVFGATELALSVGLIVGSIGLLGVTAAVPKLALTMGRPEIEDLIAFASLCVCIPATLAAVAVLVLGLPPIWALIFANAAPAVMQNSLSTFARTRALPLMNSVVDPSATLTTVAVGLGLYALGALGVANMAVVSTALSAVITGVALTAFLKLRRPGFAELYRHALGVALPMLLFGVSGLLVAVSLRPILGSMFPLREIATYSLVFRICGALLIIHQVITTGFFARIYVARAKIFDLLMAVVTIILNAVSFVLIVGISPLIREVFPSYLASINTIHRLIPLVSLQVILWIILALLENQVNRHEVSRSASVASYGMFAVFLAVTLGLWRLTGLSLTSVVVAFDILMVILSLVHGGILWRKGVRLPATGAAIVLSALGLFTASMLA